MMRGNYSFIIPAACLSLVIGACSSSGGATPNQSVGTSGEVGTSLAGLSNDDNAGIGGTSGVPAETVGDTAGAVVDGVGTTGGGSDIVGAAAVSVMQGEWVTRCLELGSLFRQQTLSVVGSRMLIELSAYSDQACSVPGSLGVAIDGSTVQRSATTVLTGNTRPVSLGDAIEVNFYFEESTVDNKPLPATDFPGRDEFIEKTEYDIVLVQDNILYFGDTTIFGYAGNSAQSRPMSLNTLSTYSRVP